MVHASGGCSELGGCCELEGVVSWIDFVGDTCPSVVVEVNEKHPEELPVGQRCC